MTKEKIDPMQREIYRKSDRTLLGAIFGNPGSLTYTAAKHKLRRFYKERDEHLRYPKYEKVITGAHTLLPILLPLLMLLVIWILLILSST